MFIVVLQKIIKIIKADEAKPRLFSRFIVPLNSEALKINLLMMTVSGRRKTRNITSLFIRIRLSPFRTISEFKKGRVLKRKLAGKNARI